MANTDGLYVNTKPEGLAGIVYNDYFFRAPDGGEWSYKCSAKLNGNCYIYTGYRVKRLSSEIIKVHFPRRSEYLCRLTGVVSDTSGECTANGWIVRPWR